MDYKTKECYRNKIKEIANYTKISEIYIANKALELSKKEKDKNKVKESHIGYYLISDGYEFLMKSLNFKFKMKKQNNNIKKYINAVWILSVIFTIAAVIGFNNKFKNIFLAIVFGILVCIPISEIIIQTINYILSKTVKPKLIPKLDFNNGIPKECKTFVVIPTMIKDSKKIKELFNKLETYYFANKSPNIYFALLGDCSSSKNENQRIDEEIIRIGLEEANKLNNKYPSDNIDIPKFSFIYRKRKWNKNEEQFMGWERKRGLLCEFNNFLINGTNDFKVCTLSNRRNEVIIRN